MNRFTKLVAAMALVVALSPMNTSAQVALTVDAAWTSFSWTGPGTVYPIFTVSSTSAVEIWITDDFIPGDGWSVRDLLEPAPYLGWTSTDLLGPDVFGLAAWTDPQFERGIFQVGSGYSEIKLRTVRAADGYPDGSAWIRAATSTSVPEPASALLIASGLLGLAWRRRNEGDEA